MTLDDVTTSLQDLDRPYSVESSMDLDFTIVTELVLVGRALVPVQAWTFDYAGDVLLGVAERLMSGTELL